MREMLTGLQNNYAVLLYTNLGQTDYMPLLLSAVWLTTAGVIYNPLGAWSVRQA